MDRKLLQILLQSGPARKFDVRYFANKMDKETKEAQGLMFETDFLNESILFKFAAVEQDRSHDSTRPVTTLVYLPYDPVKPGDGGESFVFTRDNYGKFCEYKKKFRHEECHASERDLEILTVLDSVPTFSPLILELAFQRASLAIPDAYLDLTDAMRIKLKSLMKSRVRPLIVSAFGNEPRRVESAVEELTAKMFNLQNASEIMPFIVALRLPPSHAVDLMASWVGITYFEHEYTSVQQELQGVAEFLTGRPYNRAMLTRVHKDEIYRNTEYVRGRLKEDWARIRTLSIEYKNMYEGLVFHGDIMGFRNFLLKCKTSYWELGDLLGRLEQIAIAWKTFFAMYRSEPTAGAMIDFLILLRSLSTVTAVKTTIDDTIMTADSGFASLTADLF